MKLLNYNFKIIISSKLTKKIIKKGVCIRHLKLIHNNNMKISKTISIVLVLITIVTTFSIFQNTSNAATYIIEEADLYSKGEIVCFKYGDVTVGVEYIVYRKDGVEYPAYCLNRDLPGVTEEDRYTVKVDQIVNNNKIWRAVTNGYPFKTRQELGCYSNIEAFAATKMAVYDAMYNYDWNDFTALDAQGQRILTAAEKISKAARASTATKPVSIVNVKTDDTKWDMDSINKEYASKTFYVTTNVESNEYSVKLNNVEIQNVKVTDLNNAEKTTFKTGEKLPEPDLFEKLEIMKLHLDEEIKLRGENVAIKFFRKFYPYYIEGIRNASKIRGVLVVEENYNKILEYIEYIKKENNTSDKILIS